MRRRLRQNATNVSEIYIGRPIYISDIRYINPTSDIYIRYLGTYIRLLGTYIRHPGTYIRHPGAYIRHPGTYIRHPGTYIRRPIYILDVRYLYPMSDIQYPTSARAWARARARARAGILDVGYRYQTSDIYIGCRIYILDVRYRFRKHWWHFVLNGASYKFALIRSV